MGAAGPLAFRTDSVRAPEAARNPLKGMALPVQRVDSHTWLAGLSVPFEAFDPG